MSTKEELAREREALVKGSMDVIEARKALGEGLSDPERAQLKSANERIADIDEESGRIDEDAGLIAAFSGRKAAPAAAGACPAPAAKALGDDRRKSLGDVAVEQLAERVRAAKAGGGRYALGTDDIHAKAIEQQRVDGWDEGVPYLTDYDRSVVRGKRERLVVADLIGSGSVTGNAISYLVESPLVEGGFENVAEAGAKPRTQFGAPTAMVDSVKKIAGWTKFTDEFLEDLAFLKTEIDTRLTYLLGVHEERQILGGDGAGQNLLGVRRREGVQKVVSASPADDADAIFRATTKIGLATDFSADALVIHPLDYQRFRLSRDGNGQYYGGGYFQGQYGSGSVLESPPLWGLRTVVTTAVEQGVVLVGNYALGATLYRKGGVRIDVTNSNEDDFKNNLTLLRIEERVALAVRHPAAFVEVSLAAPAKPPAKA